MHYNERALADQKFWYGHRLYQEKLEELDDKIQKINEGNAPEYLHPQKELKRTLSQRLETAESHLLGKVRCIIPFMTIIMAHPHRNGTLRTNLLRKSNQLSRTSR